MMVKRGQALAELDPRDYQLAKSSSSSQVTAAQSDLALAQAEYRRFQELKTNQFVSELDLDRKRVAVTAARGRKSIPRPCSSSGSKAGSTP